MDLFTIAGARFRLPAFSCPPRPATRSMGLATAGYAKQAMAGGVLDGHIQDANGRFWDPVGLPPPGRTPR